VAIKSFGDRATERFFETGRVGQSTGWASAASVARRKLDMLHYAVTLSDLKSPPAIDGSPPGSLIGSHSVRINDRWRIVFEWTSDGPTEVRIADYH
jgi:proteic killer suppression protein